MPVDSSLLILSSALHASPSLQDLRQDQHNDAPQETVVNRSIPLVCGPKVDQDRFTWATVMRSDDVPPSLAGCPCSGLLRQGSIGRPYRVRPISASTREASCQRRLT
jgi:hypothetical protein